MNIQCPWEMAPSCDTGIYALKQRVQTMKQLLSIAILAILCSTLVFAENDGAAAKITLAKVSYKASTVRCRNGIIANPNFRSDRGTYLKVPQKYSGWKATYPERKGDSLKFEVEKAGIVTVMNVKSMSGYLLADGWKEVSTAYVDWRAKDDRGGDVESAEQNITLIILGKHLDVGKYEIRAAGSTTWPRLLMKR